MDLFYLVVRILLLTLGSLLGVIYLLMQFWQKVPATKLKFKPYDYVTFALVAFLFGIGANNYWGLAAFVPLVLWKLVAGQFIQKSRLTGSGRWMEVQWMKLLPKGFNIPREMASELQKIPGDTHFIVPRFVSLWAVRYFVKAMRKNSGRMPTNMKGQEAQAFHLVESMAGNISKLGAGKTESVSLPFGILKITRL